MSTPDLPPALRWYVYGLYVGGVSFSLILRCEGIGYVRVAALDVGELFIRSSSADVFPSFELEYNHGMARVWTCADSFQTLVDTLVYYFDDGDLIAINGPDFIDRAVVESAGEWMDPVSDNVPGTPVDVVVDIDEGVFDVSASSGEDDGDNFQDARTALQFVDDFYNDEAGQGFAADMGVEAAGGFRRIGDIQATATEERGGRLAAKALQPQVRPDVIVRTAGVLCAHACVGRKDVLCTCPISRVTCAQMRYKRPLSRSSPATWRKMSRCLSSKTTLRCRMPTRTPT